MRIPMTSRDSDRQLLQSLRANISQRDCSAECVELGAGAEL